MILIESIRGGYTMTTLTHEEIRMIANEQNLKISAHYPTRLIGNQLITSKQKSHWIADPSAIQFLKYYCQHYEHVFTQI